MLNGKSCDNCKFWDDSNDPEGLSEYGKCSCHNTYEKWSDLCSSWEDKDL
jgi:hypothetical protein